MEVILSHLSARVTDVIADGNRIQHLIYLLRFLERWEKRPACLTVMAYEWCSVISEVVRGLRQGGMQINQHSCLRSCCWVPEEELSLIGPGCDVVHLDNASHAREHPQGPTPEAYVDLLLAALEVAFRQTGPSRDQPALQLNHTPHHDQMFEAVFSSDDDEVIADAVCAWIVGDCTPAGSIACYFAKRVEKTEPFSPRLRQVTIRAIYRIWRSEVTTSALETVRLLHCLDVDVDDVDKKYGWLKLFVGVIRSPTGFESLSSYYWRLLGKLTSTTYMAGDFALRDMEVMRSLEEVEDWEKLEVWMASVWQSLPLSSTPPELIEDIEQVTLRLASRQPSALQRFEDLCERDATWFMITLPGICDQVRAEQASLKPLPPP